MAEINEGGPAFPIVHAHDTHWAGMTLRDYFAAKAMHAIYMRMAGSPADSDATSLDYTAKWAYAQADAMLRRRA